ncbi:hypothetical protein A3I58_00455 [Candidatus Peregrinibacteria bacterium RIFCSPLOWO2_02_FULL_39_10]|nr:MAG: hypothetical protein A3I58_00455 [Candidatus Peregrinibacteria bacterium RIFCSPLOWO2_02_FULL_39_10]
MRWFKKSILRNLFLELFIFLALAGGVFFYFYKKGVDTVSLKHVGLFLGVFTIYFLVIGSFYIVKPLRTILLQMQALLSGKPYKQIYTERIDEIGILAHFFNQVTAGLGEASYDIKDRERMLSELNVAAQLQKDILPPKNPVVEGLQIVAKNKPATEVGGDIFNFITVKDKTYIYIGDATGHGVAAGLIMTMVSTLVSVFSGFFESTYDILVNVNKYVKSCVKKAMFMTMVMLCWDKSTKKMTFVGAGHEHILVYHANSGECEAILSGGVAIGMVPDNSKAIKEQSLNAEDGDYIVLYSDGITEAKNSLGEMFGLERLKNLVVEYAPQYSAEGVNYHIAKSLVDFMQDHSQDDDMTLIVIKLDKNSSIVENPNAQATNW